MGWQQNQSHDAGAFVTPAVFMAVLRVGVLVTLFAKTVDL
jgi:hypothetical protein